MSLDTRNSLTDGSFVRRCFDRFCNHQLKDGMNNLHGCKRRNLAVVVICRRHFNYVSSNDIEAFQSSQNGQQLASAPATRLWRASCYYFTVSEWSLNYVISHVHILPGAYEGSSTSISTLMYVLVSPTRCRIFSMMAWVPVVSISRAVIISKPHRTSFRMSALRRVIGARIPAWIDELRMRFCESEQVAIPVAGFM